MLSQTEYILRHSPSQLYVLSQEHVLLRQMLSCHHYELIFGVLLVTQPGIFWSVRHTTHNRPCMISYKPLHFVTQLVLYLWVYNQHYQHLKRLACCFLLVCSSESSIPQPPTELITALTTSVLCDVFTTIYNIMHVHNVIWIIGIL